MQKEQYVTDAIVAGDILYVIGFENGDLFGRLVVDLGCGPGRLTVGAALLGADSTVGVDIDFGVLGTCRTNALKFDAWSRIHLVNADIGFLPFRGIDCPLIHACVVVQNPPFGKHDRNADRRFLIAAFSLARNIYSVHLSHPKTRLFFDGFADESGFFIDQIYEYPLILERSQDFHTKTRKKIFVDLYHFVKKRE